MLNFFVTDFDLDMIMDCGQAFRWQKLSEKVWLGIVANKVVRITQRGNEIIIEGDQEASKDFWKDYFDLERDYGQIKHDLLLLAPELADAIQFGSGIRLLNQDPFEMLITFILSANNHIPRIKELVRKLSENYGNEIPNKWELEIGKAYSFPTAKALAKATVTELRALGLGYRDQYVFDTARVVANDPDAFQATMAKDYSVAKKELLGYSGVGPKVADCILLFASRAHESFPTDTWIKKTMSRRYGIKENDGKQLAAIIEKYGHLKGFAQQYLFYFERENEKRD